VWRSTPRRSGTGTRPNDQASGAPGTPARVPAAQRRALRLVGAGRLSAAARALTAAPVAPGTPAVWDKARSLFPPARPGPASRAFVEGAFPAELEAEATYGRASGVPRMLLGEAVADAILRAPRGSARGLSGLRMEHLRALGDAGQSALAGVVRLLAGEEAELLISPLAAHALAGADLLLLCKPGGLDVDGLPRLRPIGMPEVLRKLAAASLEGTVRAAAAWLLAPLQMGVGVSNPCERVVHEVTAELVHHPLAALLQLDFSNAFNLVSSAAAVAYLTRAFPLLRHYLSPVYLGSSPPRVYGWADGDSAPGAAGGLVARRWVAVERGVQQGDPLSPLLHAAAMHLAVLRLAAAHSTAVVRAVHEDVVVVAALADLPAVLTTAAAAGAAVDAELAPAKCAGWSPTGAPAPAGWPARWNAEGVRQFSIPLGSDNFVAAEVHSLAADHGRLTAAIVNLLRTDLQSQLLLLRLCAGPQPNYWLSALPLVWGARLAASVDRAAQGALRRLLTDALDPPAAVDALLDRAALPLSHGGLGIGGRTVVVPAAALASRIDALRAWRLYSPVLAAVADSLAALDGAAATGGAPAAPSLDRLRPPGGRSPPPPAARPPPRLPVAAASVPGTGASSVAAHGGAALPVVPAAHPAAAASPTAASDVGASLVFSSTAVVKPRAAGVEREFRSPSPTPLPPLQTPHPRSARRLSPGPAPPAASDEARPGDTGAAAALVPTPPPPPPPPPHPQCVYRRVLHLDEAAGTPPPPRRRPAPLTPPPPSQARPAASPRPMPPIPLLLAQPRRRPGSVAGRQPPKRGRRCPPRRS